MASAVSVLQQRYGISQTWAFLRRTGVHTISALAATDVNLKGTPNKQVLGDIILFANIYLSGNVDLLAITCKTLGIKGMLTVQFL